MKSVILIINLFFLSTLSFGQESKTHFDNKPYIDGEMLVQILDNIDINDVIKRAPASYGLTIGEELSPPMRIWLIEFDENMVTANKIQHWFYSQPEITVADYNYHVEMRSTLPGDPTLSSQWHHNNTGGGGGTEDADIDSDLAWDITQGGQTAYNDDTDDTDEVDNDEVDN